ncbi:MAG: hypothetical protein MI784_06780 [Cytophagales bacterium]|nr:hypothetical protein [Cytophagales bacterium]
MYQKHSSRKQIKKGQQEKTDGASSAGKKLFPPGQPGFWSEKPEYSGVIQGAFLREFFLRQIITRPDGVITEEVKRRILTLVDRYNLVSDFYHVEGRPSPNVFRFEDLEHDSQSDYTFRLNILDQLYHLLIDKLVQLRRNEPGSDMQQVLTVALEGVHKELGKNLLGMRYNSFPIYLNLGPGVAADGNYLEGELFRSTINFWKCLNTKNSPFSFSTKVAVPSEGTVMHHIFLDKGLSNNFREHVETMLFQLMSRPGGRRLVLKLWEQVQKQNTVVPIFMLYGNEAMVLPEDEQKGQLQVDERGLVRPGHGTPASIFLPFDMKTKDLVYRSETSEPTLMPPFVYLGWLLLRALQYVSGTRIGQRHPVQWGAQETAGSLSDWMAFSPNTRLEPYMGQAIDHEVVWPAGTGNDVIIDPNIGFTLANAMELSGLPVSLTEILQEHRLAVPRNSRFEFSFLENMKKSIGEGWVKYFEKEISAREKVKRTGPKRQKNELSTEKYF